MKVIINTRTSGKFKREIIDGRSHLVTIMMPIRGDITMNNKFYPDKEVTLSFMQLNMLPAPNGHPSVNGIAVPAFHPVANNKHNIGGFLRNPRKKGKRVFVDFMLDEEVANNSEHGKELIKRIESGQKIGVSTGLGIAQVTNKSGKDDFGKAFNQEVAGYNFDHVAILLNEHAAGEHAGTELILNEENEEILVYNAEWQIDEEETPTKIIKTNIIPNIINEVNTMDKAQLAYAIIGNSANKYVHADHASLAAMSDDDLLKIVSNTDKDGAKRILTNSGFEFDKYDNFVANKSSFDLYLKDKAEVDRVMIDNIIKNSEYTDDMLKDKSSEELDVINNMLTPEKIAIRIAEQGQEKILTNATDNNDVDYTS